MNILVTGGAGFIGSNFIRHMFREHPDCMIVNLDARTYAGNPNNLLDFDGRTNYEFIKGNICNQVLVEDILWSRSIDAIVNFAAESFVDKSILNSKPFVDSNVDGVRSLLDASRHIGVEKFVQISTDEVYGSIESGQFTEESNLYPRNPYSASKASGDLLAMSYFVTFGVPVVITRSSNNYGPYQYPEKFIQLAITNLIEGGKIPVYGQGKNVRDWLHVCDNCAGIDAVLNKGKIGEVYNISGDNERENIQIAGQIAQSFGKDGTEIEFIKDRLGHDLRYSLSHEKLTRALGWLPQIKFEDGLAGTIEWYKDNESWWTPLKGKAEMRKRDLNTSFINSLV